MQAQGFMFDGGDEFATVVYQDDDEEEEMPGTGIHWTVIGEAMGASEELELQFKNKRALCRRGI